MYKQVPTPDGLSQATAPQSAIKGTGVHHRCLGASLLAYVAPFHGFDTTGANSPSAWAAEIITVST